MLPISLTSPTTRIQIAKATEVPLADVDKVIKSLEKIAAKQVRERHFDRVIAEADKKHHTTTHKT